MAKIKICGIYRPEDTDMINEAQPDYFGMILGFKKSHRCVEREQAKALRALVDASVPAVGVFVDEEPSVIEAYLEEDIIQVAQLHGHETEADIRALQRRTGKPVWKAFKIRSRADLERAMESPADMILLDNGYGTGETFDWSLITTIDRPFALAGGMTPDNIGLALQQLQPAIIDISSGVETEKKKDRNKILAAVAAVRNS